MGNLDHLTRAFTRVGWFIPPFMGLGALSALGAKIERAGASFTQADLETALSEMYEPVGLASMVVLRYPTADTIKDYHVTIREAVEAHFSGLDHVAVGGLAPVIEGAGRRLASQRGLTQRSVRDVFTALASDCKADSINRSLGDSEEVAAMMDSFSTFAKDSFFANSKLYPFDDGTNRHGISHGDYSDADYGSPINFYKTIAAVDFLTFISTFRGGGSWLGPDPSTVSMRLAAYYRALKAFSATRPPYS